MILYPYGKNNPHYLSSDLMVIIFQQFLLEVRFSSQKIFTCTTKDYFYLFSTNIHREGNTKYYTLEGDQVRNCENLEVLILLTDQVNSENEY